jgi:hypothetical protein
MVRIMYQYRFSLMLSVARIARIECLCSTSEVVRLLRERVKRSPSA